AGLQLHLRPGQGLLLVFWRAASGQRPQRDRSAPDVARPAGAGQPPAAPKPLEGALPVTPLRVLAIAALLVAPTLVLAGIGSWMIWVEGRFVWLWWLLPICWI